MYPNLYDIITYVIQKLEDKTLASLPYLKRFIYLLDLEYCIETGTTYTEAKWEKDEDGISIIKFSNIIDNSKDVFKINPIENSLFYLSLLNPNRKTNLDPVAEECLIKIWKDVGNQHYVYLASRVFSSYPYYYYSGKKIKEVDIAKSIKKLKSML